MRKLHLHSSSQQTGQVVSRVVCVIGTVVVFGLKERSVIFGSPHAWKYSRRWVENDVLRHLHLPLAVGIDAFVCHRANVTHANNNGFAGHSTWDPVDVSVGPDLCRKSERFDVRQIRFLSKQQRVGYSVDRSSMNSITQSGSVLNCIGPTVYVHLTFKQHGTDHVN